MGRYKKTKKQLKIEKNNLIKAYTKLHENGKISKSEFKKSIEEIKKDYKKEGV